MQLLSRLLVFPAILLVVAVSPAPGASGPLPKDVITALEKGYGQLSDLQADFSQYADMPSFHREDQSTGELSIKKSGGSAMFRFNYRKPKQQVISNGKTVWIYVPANKQVITSDAASLFEGGNAIALSYLTGMGHLSTDFSASTTGNGRDKKGNYLIDLIPRKNNPSISKLQLTVSAAAVDEFLASGKVNEPFPVISSTVYDQMGNRIRIDFSKVRVNRGIGTDRFNFQVPPGVEVISPGK